MTISLIILNCFIFVYFTLHQTIVSGITEFGLVNSAGLSTWNSWLTLLTSLFIHGNWLHLLANMWLLWIFGSRIESVTGRWFLPLYLGGGMVAGMVAMALAPNFSDPSFGASGALTFLFGMFVVMFPQKKIWSMRTLVTSNQTGDLPQVTFSIWFIIILWFILQLIPAFIGAQNGLPDADGVAYLTHLGGVLVGLTAGYGWKRNTSIVLK